MSETWNDLTPSIYFASFFRADESF